MPGLMIATERQVFDELEALIQTNHRAGNIVGLAENYAEGASLYEREGEVDAACFYWTQAYVLALEAGMVELTSAMYTHLRAHDRMGDAS